MTISDISPLARVTLNGSGNGQVGIGPPSGTKWALRLATAAVSTQVKQPQCSFYRGSPTGPLELVDFTFTGAAASSGKVAGVLYYPGQWLWAVWTGGDAGAIATLQAYGQQGARSDPLPPSPLGEGFANSTAIIRGNELDLGTTPQPRIAITPNIPSVLANWDAVNVVFNVVFLWYYNATDFYFQAIGTFFGDKTYMEGTYDTTNGPYMINRVLQPTAAGAVEQRIGSYFLNTFALTLNLQQIALDIGTAAINDSLVIACPAISTDIKFNKVGVAETWHAAAFQNGWSNVGGTNITAQYRLVASPPSSVQVVGTIAPGTKVDGTTMFNLPVGYRPVHDQFFPIAANGSIAGGLTPQVQITTGGNVNCFGVNFAGLANIELNCMVTLDG